MSETRYYATGKRKRSVARCWLIPGGEGRITVNQRPVEDYFPRATDIMVLRQPLNRAELADQMDVMCTVHGGGTTGQAGAIRHGIARALVEYNAELKGLLKNGGFLTRDARKKERKKYGQKGARARFQYSKR